MIIKKNDADSRNERKFLVEEFDKHEGEYIIKDTIAKLKDEKGAVHEISMYFNWPVKIPRSATSHCHR